MELLNELFKSPVGILSMITILFVMVIATFLFFWVKSKQTAARKLIYRYLFPLDVCVFGCGFVPHLFFAFTNWNNRRYRPESACFTL